MDCGYSILLTVGILAICLNTCDLQILKICDLPLKTMKCILQCETKDFEDIITFSDPSGKDVGSCASLHDCKSRFSHYRLKQKNNSTHYFTELNIIGLDRDRDQGNWECKYGNRASPSVLLTVHTKPKYANISVIEVEEKPRIIKIKCICYCVYPLKSTSIGIYIENQEIKSGSRDDLLSLNSSGHNCAKDESVAMLAVKAHRDNWVGKSIPIKCNCMIERFLSGLQTSLSYVFYGAPEKPHNVRIRSVSSDKLTVEWIKGFNGGHIQTFVVLYKWDTNKIVTKYLQEDRTYHYYNMTLDKLIPNTVYKIWIYASNKKGNSSETSPLEAETLEEPYIWIILSVVCFLLGGLILTTITYLAIKCYKRKKTRPKQAKRHRKPRPWTWVLYVILICVLVFVIVLVAFSSKPELKTLIVISILLSIIPTAVFNIICFILPHKKVVTETIETITDEIEVTKFLPEDDKLSQTAKNIEDFSIAKIAKATSTGTFVNTRGFIGALKILATHGVLIYQGLKQDGRRTHAMHIMNEWKQKYCYHPIILKNISKWDEIVNIKVKMVVLIPDIFSTDIKNLNMFDQVKLWNDMMWCVKNGKTKLIMICNTSDTNALWMLSQKCKLFDSKYQIDLSASKYSLTDEEKRQILLKHLMKNKIQICSERKDENCSFSVASNKRFIVKISKDTITKIVGTQPDSGYERSCALFCKERKHVKLGVAYFLQQSKSLVDHFDSLRDSKIDNEIRQYKILHSLWYNGSRKFDDQHKDALDALTGVYITNGAHGMYHLKDETVYGAVGLCIGKREPDSVLTNCDWNFIKFFVKCQANAHNDEGSVLLIKSNLYMVLVDKFFQDLNKDTVKNYFNNICEVGNDILQEILESAKENKQFNDIIIESCGKEDGVFVDTCFRGNNILLEELWKRYGNEISIEILKLCKDSPNTDGPIQRLLEEWINTKMEL